jgi:superfamily II DNA/RNA helicase
MAETNLNLHPTLSFADLKLDPILMKGISNCAYTEPTGIQQRAIPVALQGRDIIATSQTGSGKTAAFVIPILQRLLTKKAGKANRDGMRKPIALILSPTRELAQQTTAVIDSFTKTIMKVNVCSILGGMSYHVQMRQLRGPVDIIVATPGRLIDYMERGQMNLSEVEVLVLDEADRMLDMGFIDDVEYIAKATPSTRQTLLFTATLGDRLARLARNILNEPERIEVLGQKVTLENIAQHVHISDNAEHKNKLLKHILAMPDFNKAIIFSATKRNADSLARQLIDDGFKASALHGDMNQSKRNRTLSQLRDGRITVVVATDVAARGIDIHDVSHVVNYDMPKFAEDYVHRIGRTGRAGRAGIAVSFVTSNDFAHLKSIERFTGQTISQQTINGLEPKKPFHNSSAKPNGKNSSRRGGGGYSNQQAQGRGQSRGRNPAAAAKQAGYQFRKKSRTDSASIW